MLTEISKRVERLTQGYFGGDTAFEADGRPPQGAAAWGAPEEFGGIKPKRLPVSEAARKKR
jgi:hypothetical protein